MKVAASVTTPVANSKKVEAAAVPAEPAIRILKIATCPSLSGKSNLTYHLGCTTEGEILLRVYANTAAGFFNNDWVDISRIQQLLAKGSVGKLTSFVLKPLFQGKSTNTPPFIFAALLNEVLVQPSTTTKRCYEATDGKEFSVHVKALVGSKVDLTDKVPQVSKAEKAEKAQKASGTKPGNKPENNAGKQAGAKPGTSPDGTPEGTASKTRRAAKLVTKEPGKEPAKAKPGSVSPSQKATGKTTPATA